MCGFGPKCVDLGPNVWIWAQMCGFGPKYVDLGIAHHTSRTRADVSIIPC